MEDVREAIKALMDGCEAVEHHESLRGSREEFLSELFLKKHPVLIFHEKEEEIKELKPHAIGFYLSRQLIDELAESKLAVILFAEDFDSDSLSFVTKGVLLLGEEVFHFRVDPRVWEISALFALLANHTEEKHEL